VKSINPMTILWRNGYLIVLRVKNRFPFWFSAE
jgi:hypothetical protein